MSYPGGKNGSGVFQKIINQMPPHRVYVEGFLGGGAIMRMKRPAVASIGIDADGEVISQARTWAGGIPRLELIQGDAIMWLAAANALDGDTLVYLDPPYLMSTRLQQRPIYRCELSEGDHLCLLKLIKMLPCMVIISGYRSELYEWELAGWRVETFQTTNRAGKPTTEYLWLNFPKPLELHDYRYLGQNFREWERIKRKKARWVKRLTGMDSLERYALMEVIGELRRSYNVGDGDVDVHIAGANEANRLVSPGMVIAPCVAMGAPSAGNGEAGGMLDVAMGPAASIVAAMAAAGNAESGDGSGIGSCSDGYR